MTGLYRKTRFVKNDPIFGEGSPSKVEFCTWAHWCTVFIVVLKWPWHIVVFSFHNIQTKIKIYSKDICKMVQTFQFSHFRRKSSMKLAKMGQFLSRSGHYVHVDKVSKHWSNGLMCKISSNHKWSNHNLGPKTTMRRIRYKIKNRDDNNTHCAWNINANRTKIA